MTEPSLALRMRGIRKAYPGVQALSDAGLDVRAGEVHVLLGENGAGKSTLMKILSGAVTADAGEILIDGRAARIRTPADARRLGIRTIYQELSLGPHLTVAENVHLGNAPTLAAGIVDWGRMRRSAAALLEGLGMPLDPVAPVASLRLAQQQMVEIARALAGSARILVMDEPTSALSEREVEHLFATIRQLTAQGVAVVYISHRMDEMFRIGDRVTVLRDGRHVATRDIAGSTIPELVRLMADREVSDHYPRRSHPRGEELLRVEGLAGGALQGISFVLHRGEVLGVAGLAGAGRTRLARALAGADRAAQGRIFVRGREVAIGSPADAAAAGIGFLPEDRKQQGLVLPLSVEHNVSMSHLSRLSRAGIVDRAAERREAEEGIASLRIRTQGPRQPVRDLSGGSQQKVVLAKWLAARAGILIFDEPTRGIDVAARQDIYRIINQLVEQGAGVIMISSDLPEVLGMSDRILVMRGGAVQLELPAAEATDTRVLQAALGIAS